MTLNLRELEATGMLQVPLWLHHHPSEAERASDAISTGLRIHDRAVKRARAHLEDHHLATTQGTAGAGRGAPVVTTLTRQGEAYAGALHRASLIIDPKDDYALRELERAHALSLLHHLHDAREEDRYVRAIMTSLHLPPPQLKTLREVLLALDLIMEEGVRHGGLGARIHLHLTPRGQAVHAELQDAFARLR